MTIVLIEPAQARNVAIVLRRFGIFCSLVGHAHAEGVGNIVAGLGIP